MLRNYLKIALRNLWRQKMYSSLNIIGLAVGLTAFILMSMYAKHEFTYDSFFKGAERIVRITSELKTPEEPMQIALSPVLLTDALNRDYPAIQKATRLQSIAATVKYGDKIFNEEHVYYTDPTVFEVFSYRFKEGNSKAALAHPNTMILTESFAKKYGGQTHMLGQILYINQIPYTVTGIIEDLPSNTDLKINALVSHNFTNTKTWIEEDLSVFTFALFKTTPNLRSLEQQLNKLSEQKISPELKRMGAEGYSLVFHAEMFADVHYSQGKLEDTPKGNKQYSYLFLFLALFVLTIALLNYISLLTARAAERAKEVGVRKTNGARRSQIILQFLFEALLLSFFAVIIGIVMLESCIPVINQLLGIRLQLSLNETALWAISTLAFTTLLGGGYPALVLSDFNPTQVLKGAFSQSGRALGFRRFITTFQFTLTASMIAGVLIIYAQMNFLQKHHLGFDKNQVLVVQLPSDSASRAKGYVLAAALRQRSEVSDLTVGTGLQPDAMGSTSFKVEGKAREVMTKYSFVDPRFVPLLGMRLVAGRNLSEDISTDKKEAFIVNEAFVKMSGWKQPLGQSIKGFMHDGKVVGVIKNFHYYSLHNAVEPLVLVYSHMTPNSLMLKIKPEHLSVVKSLWQNHYPEFPFEYSFLDATLNLQYQKEALMMKLFNAFAFLTILVSCLGLFSLVTFTTELRTKEVGIRKVLGASVGSIMALLTQDFLKLICIAIIIATPLSFYVMSKWLEDFAYRITIQYWIFGISALLTFSIALFTVSFQVVKAALMNPVKSLKSE